MSGATREPSTGSVTVDDLASEAQKLVAHTYYGLRWGLAVLAFSLPIVLWFGFDWLTEGVRHPTSMSAFYHTPLRNYFVATVVALGLFLLLYKGFSKAENRWLNFAGCAAITLAFIPTDRDRGATDPPDTWVSPHVLGLQVHGLAAIGAFGAMGLVAILFAKNTLDKLPAGAQAVLFGRTVPLNAPTLLKIYRGIGASMIGAVALAVVTSKFDDYWLFGFEALALWIFVAYWIVKTVEFRASGAETRAIRGEAFPSPSTRAAVQDLRAT